MELGALDKVAPLLEIRSREAPAGVGDLVGGLEDRADLFATAIEAGADFGDGDPAGGHVPLGRKAFLQGVARGVEEARGVFRGQGGIHGGE